MIRTIDIFVRDHVPVCVADLDQAQGVFWFLKFMHFPLAMFLIG